MNKKGFKRGSVEKRDRRMDDERRRIE